MSLLLDALGQAVTLLFGGDGEVCPDHRAGRPAGALVVGISACIRHDARDWSFLELVGSQVATAVANARAY